MEMLAAKKAARCGMRTLLNVESTAWACMVQAQAKTGATAQRTYWPHEAGAEKGGKSCAPRVKVFPPLGDSLSQNISDSPQHR